MSKFVWIFVGVIVAVFLYAGVRLVATPKQVSEPTPPASAAPPTSTSKCVKERRMHAFGTYQAHYATRGTHESIDAPIDLTIVECLEWETPSTEPSGS